MQLLDVDSDDELHYNEDDTPCPVDCVIEVFTHQELQDILTSSSPDALIVCDLYKTACGACKYIQPGFVKLCKATSGETPLVIFIKHNVYDDEEEELTDLAKAYNIKVRDGA